MHDVRLVKILDETYRHRFLVTWFDDACNLHIGAFAQMPVSATNGTGE